VKIYRQPSFDRALRKLAAEQQADVDAALAKLPSVWGRPHLHSGLGIRRIGPFFECRAGLKLRILFLPGKDSVTALAIGTHDGLVAFLKNF